MKDRSAAAYSALAAVLSLGLAHSDGASAGQFKTLNTASLAVNASEFAISRPKNTGNAMELEAYEWQTAPAGGRYRCRITNNATGRTLNIRLIGVDATVVNSCSAPNGGSCSAPTIGLAGNLKFQCLVATSNGQPVNALPQPNYTMAVQRLP